MAGQERRVDCGGVPDEELASGQEVVEQHWPYDGPHGFHRTSTAAETMDQLVRYLNNATCIDTTLPHAASGHDVIRGVGSAIHGLDQLLEQLAQFYLRHAATNPDLYGDRRDRTRRSHPSRTRPSVRGVRLRRWSKMRGRSICGARRRVAGGQGLSSWSGGPQR